MERVGDQVQLLKEKSLTNGFKISHFQEELLNDLDQLGNWPEKVKTMQKIG